MFAPLLDRFTAADQLGISPRKLSRLVVNGQIAHVEIEGEVRFDQRDLAEFVEQHRHPAIPTPLAEVTP